MTVKRLTKGLAFLVLLAAVAAGAAGRGQEKKQAELTDLWIYKEATSKENARVKGKMFQPFDIMPKDRAENNDVSVSHEVPFDRREPSKGTICELSFRLKADEWAAVRFTPGGQPAGRSPGLNVKRALFLDSATPIFLIVRARTADKASAVVTFKVGGVTGAHKDGTDDHPWKFARGIKPTLTDEWKDYVIDLKGLHLELEHVACALTVNVAGEDNDGKPVTVFIDEVRFTTRR